MLLFAQTQPAGNVGFTDIILPLIPWVLIFFIIVVLFRKGRGKAE